MSRTVDGVLLGQPAIELPEDIGDGPWLTPPPDPNVPVARFGSAQIDEPHRPLRSEDGVLRSAPQLEFLGGLSVSEIIPPNRFRRFSHNIRVRTNDLYDGHRFIIRFSGNLTAVWEEEIGALANNPGTTADVGPRTTIPGRDTPTFTVSRRNPRRSTPSSTHTPPVTLPGQQGVHDNMDAVGDVLGGLNAPSANEADRPRDSGLAGALETFGEMVRPTRPARQSLYQVHVRMPLMELPGPGFSPRNFDPIPEIARVENSIYRFTMTNVTVVHDIEVPYPVGDNFPLMFDVVHRGVLYSNLVGFSAAVLIVRSD